MVNGATPALLIVIAVLILLSVTPGGLKMVSGQAASGSKTWCLAKSSTAEAELNNIIEFACSHAGVDCSVIQPGGPCSLPDNKVSHASVAMNLYYQANGRLPHDCYFGGAGLVVNDDPSYGSCKF
ncbi:unnamed protein product [Victoria cruziana]